MPLLRSHRIPRLRRQQEELADEALLSLVDRALRDVAEVVSARGMCAQEAARLASLPSRDVETIAAACQCSGCSRQRLH